MADPEYILHSYQNIKEVIQEVDDVSKQELLQLQKKTIQNYSAFSKKHPLILEKILSHKSLEGIVQQIISLQKKPEQLDTPRSDIQKFSKKFPNIISDIIENRTLELLKSIREVYQWFQEHTKILVNNHSESRNKKIKELENTHQKFREEYPKLFEGILNKTLEEDTLLYMIKMLSKMKKKNLSEHDASVEVGTHLVDRFVKPNLEKQ
jgi:hypothetical protein